LDRAEIELIPAQPTSGQKKKCTLPNREIDGKKLAQGMENTTLMKNTTTTIHYLGAFRREDGCYESIRKQ